VESKGALCNGFSDGLCGRGDSTEHEQDDGQKERRDESGAMHVWLRGR
jgi:hypothetical protein